MDKDFMLNYYDKMVRPTWTELMKTPCYQRTACERDKIEREYVCTACVSCVPFTAKSFVLFADSDEPQRFLTRTA